MSAEAEGLQIPVGFSLEEAQLALRQLEQMARDAGKRIKGAGDQAGDDFAGSISKWRKEEKAEGRQVGFLVDQFTAGLVPATGAAREGVNLLTKALIGGLGLGLALDVAGAGARLLVEHFEKETKKQEEAKKAAEEHAKALRGLRADTDDYIRGLRGATGALAYLYAENRKLDEEQLPLLQKKAELEREIAKLRTSGWRGLSGETAAAEKEQLASVEQALARIAERRGQVGTEFRTREGAEETGAREKKNAEITKAIRDARNAAEDKQFEERYQLRLDREQAYIDADNAKFEMHYQMQLDKEKAFNAADDALFVARYEMQLAREKAYNDADDAQFISHYEMQLAREQAYIDIENQMFEQQYQEQQALIEQRNQMWVQGFRTLASSAVGEFGKMLTSSRAYSAAMRAAGKATQEGADLSAAAFAKMGQDMLATIAQQAAVEAIMQTARGFAFASIGEADSASAAFAAAGMFAATAAAAGAAAMVIGQTRGTTRAERASLSADTTLGGASVFGVTSGAREVGGSGGIAQVQTREVVIYAGDLFTPQELAQAHARRAQLATDLGLLRAS